jgi:hypothetical protein
MELPGNVEILDDEEDEDRPRLLLRMNTSSRRVFYARAEID